LGFAFAAFGRVSTGFCQPIVNRTLQHYVEALGGRLEIHAIFDDRDIKLAARRSATPGGPGGRRFESQRSHLK
jgi:hypothetical protein